MHIHRIKSGKLKQHVKILLRRSYRDGNEVKKYTLANLSGWYQEDIELLESALKWRRLLIGTSLQAQLDLEIANLIVRGMESPANLKGSTRLGRFTLEIFFQTMTAIQHGYYRDNRAS